MSDVKQRDPIQDAAEKCAREVREQFRVVRIPHIPSELVGVIARHMRELVEVQPQLNGSEVLRVWIVNANEGRLKDGTRELSNNECALVGSVLRCVAGDMQAQQPSPSAPEPPAHASEDDFVKRLAKSTVNEDYWSERSEEWREYRIAEARMYFLPIIREYVAARVNEAERNGRWIQHQVHCPYCNQGARGCDIGRGLEAKR